MRTISESINDMLEGLSGALFVEKPCKIIKVNSQYSVDVEYYNNNVADYLYNVPVKHLQTQKAFVFLGLNIGDYGTVRFFDNDVTGYYNHTGKISGEVRKHDINDNLFSLGFYPAQSQYVFPQGDVVIGTTGGALINLTDENIIITGGNVTIGNNTTIDGKVFLEHTHTSGKEGSPTSGVN